MKRKKPDESWKTVRLRFEGASEEDVSSVLEGALGGGFAGPWGEPWTPSDGLSRRARPFEVDLQLFELVRVGRSATGGCDAPGTWAFEIEIEEPTYYRSEKGRIAAIVNEALRRGLAVAELPPAPELRRPPEPVRPLGYVRVRFRFPGVALEDLLRVCDDARFFIEELGLRRTGGCLAVVVRDPEEWADAGQAATLRRVLVQGGIRFEESAPGIVGEEKVVTAPSLDKTLEAAETWCKSRTQTIRGLSANELQDLAHKLQAPLPPGLQAVLARGLWEPLRLNNPKEIQDGTASLEGYPGHRGWIAIAEDGAGNTFVVRAKGKGAARVHFADHETHEIENTKVTFEAFVAELLRRRCGRAPRARRAADRGGDHQGRGARPDVRAGQPGEREDHRFRAAILGAWGSRRRPRRPREEIS